MLFLFLFFFFYFFLPLRCDAKVWINEFSSNSDPEWVELYNSGEQQIDLSGWSLLDGNSDPSDDLSLEGCINPGEFRSFDHPGGWLNNSGGDTIVLKKPDGSEEDSVTYGNGGVVGIPKEEETAARNPAGSSNWKIGSPSKTDNTCQSTISTPTPTPTPTPTEVPSHTPTPTSTSTPTPTSSPPSCNILHLSEIMANPEEGSEWVELYGEETDCSLAGFTLYFDEDDEGQKIELTGELAGHYWVVEAGGSWLNNSGDMVKLVKEGETKDNYQYSVAERGKSWSLVEGEWCLTNPTKGVANSNCLSDQTEDDSQPTPTSTPFLSPTATFTPTPTATTTLTPTPQPTTQPTLFIPPDSATSTNQFVLSLSASPAGEILGESGEKEVSQENNVKRAIAFALIVGGGGLLGAAFWGERKKGQESDTMANNEEEKKEEEEF